LLPHYSINKSWKLLFVSKWRGVSHEQHTLAEHKQAAPKKIRRKCATVAPYSMLYRFLCNALQRAREKSKKYGANAPQLHPIWPQAAPGAMCQRLFHESSRRFGTGIPKRKRKERTEEQEGEKRGNRWQSETA
jgi:hypothetical protein